MSKMLAESESQLSWYPQKGAERAADPDVESTFGGNGRGQFTDHEGGGQAPEEGQREGRDGDGLRLVPAPPRMSSMP